MTTIAALYIDPRGRAMDDLERLLSWLVVRAGIERFVAGDQSEATALIAAQSGYYARWPERPLIIWRTS